MDVDIEKALPLSQGTETPFQWAKTIFERWQNKSPKEMPQNDGEFGKRRIRYIDANGGKTYIRAIVFGNS